MAMVLKIGGVHEVTARASGVDGNGDAALVELSAFVIDAGDAAIAVDVAEGAVLNEPLIPDGAGGFSTPLEVTAVSVWPANVIPVASLVYKRQASGAIAKLPIDSIHEVQLFGWLVYEPSISATITVYTLNRTLRTAISLAKTEALALPFLPDPYGPPGQMVTPNQVITISAKPVQSLPSPANNVVLQA